VQNDVSRRIDRRSALCLSEIRGRGPVFVVSYSWGQPGSETVSELGEEARGLIAEYARSVFPSTWRPARVSWVSSGTNLYEPVPAQNDHTLRLRSRMMPSASPMAGPDPQHGSSTTGSPRRPSDSGRRNYYGTQSAAGFLDGIRVPLIIQAQDDPLIPFGAFRHPPLPPIRPFVWSRWSTGPPGFPFPP
jgi:hypothetical protein